jgi:hypothetical protein
VRVKMRRVLRWILLPPLTAFGVALLVSAFVKWAELATLWAGIYWAFLFAIIVTNVVKEENIQKIESLAFLAAGPITTALAAVEPVMERFGIEKPWAFVPGAIAGLVASVATLYAYGVVVNKIAQIQESGDGASDYPVVQEDTTHTYKPDVKTRHTSAVGAPDGTGTWFDMGEMAMGAKQRVDTESIQSLTAHNEQLTREMKDTRTAVQRGEISDSEAEIQRRKLRSMIEENNEAIRSLRLRLVPELEKTLPEPEEEEIETPDILGEPDPQLPKKKRKRKKIQTVFID